MKSLSAMLGLAIAAGLHSNEGLPMDDNIIPRNGSGGTYSGKHMPKKDYQKRQKRLRMQKESRKINRK